MVDFVAPPDLVWCTDWQQYRLLCNVMSQTASRYDPAAETHSFGYNFLVMHVRTHTTVLTQCVSSLAGNCRCSQAVPAAPSHAHHRLWPAYARLGLSAQRQLGNMLLRSAA